MSLLQLRRLKACIVFLNHHLKEKTTTFEDRLLNTYTIGDIKVFEINIYEHSIYYDFEEPDDVFSNFLSNL